MSAKIGFAKTSRGSEAYITSKDGSDDICIVKGVGKAKVCLEAAKRLRKMADDFEELAKKDNAYNAELQEKINNG